MRALMRNCALSRVETGSVRCAARPSPSSPPTTARCRRLYRACDAQCVTPWASTPAPSSSGLLRPARSSHPLRRKLTRKQKNALQAITSHNARLRFTSRIDANAEAYEASGQLGAAGRADAVGHATGSDFRSVSCLSALYEEKHRLSPGRTRSQGVASRRLRAGVSCFRGP